MWQTFLQKKSVYYGLIIFSLCIFIIHLFQQAWASDDAYITFRVIDNFVNGYGLRWNIAERVQAYTNTLWLFLLTPFYFFTHEIYYTQFIVSISLTVASIYLVTTRFTQSYTNIITVLLLLFFSQAFIDFSVSGLENPLTHFLLISFFIVYLKNKTAILPLALLTSAILLNRLDTILLILPSLAVMAYFHHKKQDILFFIIGLLPFIAWELFSLVYYGALFPNTAYAKLNTGIESAELITQGIIYAVHVVKHDPITAFTILAAFLLPIFRKQWQLIPLSIGILFSTLYIIKVGGDFMQGRFFSPAFIVAIIIIAASQFNVKTKINTLLALITAALVFVLITLYPPILSTEDYFNRGKTQIANEKDFYYKKSALYLSYFYSPERKIRSYWAELGKEAYERDDEKTVNIFSNMGYLGFHAKHKTFIIDYLSLTNAFLARLPATEGWRIGHFLRNLPEGYVDSIKQEKNLLTDPDLSALYADILLVTRAGIWSAERWQAIWRLNTGSYQFLIAKIGVQKIQQTLKPNSLLQKEYLMAPYVQFSDGSFHHLELKMTDFSQFLFNIHNNKVVEAPKEAKQVAGFYDQKERKLVLNAVQYGTVYKMRFHLVNDEKGGMQFKLTRANLTE